VEWGGAVPGSGLAGTDKPPAGATIAERLKAIAGSGGRPAQVGGPPAPTPYLVSADVVSIVRKTLTDAARRRRNIIVSGMRESTEQCSERDYSDLQDMCRNDLHVCIDSHVVATKRLGKSSSGGKPRRLLVTFDSESFAADMLSRARRLRDSSNSYTSANIYINRDMSQDEERAAFEHRQSRRDGGRADPGVSGAGAGEARGGALLGGRGRDPSNDRSAEGTREVRSRVNGGGRGGGRGSERSSGNGRGEGRAVNQSANQSSRTRVYNRSRAGSDAVVAQRGGRSGYTYTEGDTMDVSYAHVDADFPLPPTSQGGDFMAIRAVVPTLPGRVLNGTACPTTVVGALPTTSSSVTDLCSTNAQGCDEQMIHSIISTGRRHLAEGRPAY
jgi:hypothetical protein